MSDLGIGVDHEQVKGLGIKNGTTEGNYMFDLLLGVFVGQLPVYTFETLLKLYRLMLPNRQPSDDD